MKVLTEQNVNLMVAESGGFRWAKKKKAGPTPTNLNQDSTPPILLGFIAFCVYRTISHKTVISALLLILLYTTTAITTFNAGDGSIPLCRQCPELTLKPYCTKQNCQTSSLHSKKAPWQFSALQHSCFEEKCGLENFVCSLQVISEGLLIFKCFSSTLRLPNYFQPDVQWKLPPILF